MAMRSYSSELTEGTVAPMLLRLRSELKTAMKTKDTNRYEVYFKFKFSVKALSLSLKAISACFDLWRHGAILKT